MKAWVERWTGVVWGTYRPAATDGPTWLVIAPWSKEQAFSVVIGSRGFYLDHLPIERDDSSVTTPAETSESDSDPADYGYADLPSRGGVKVIPNTPPEMTTCRACGHVATEHTAGRFSIYGTCPTSPGATS